MDNALTLLLSKIQDTVNFGSVETMNVNTQGLFWSTPLHVAVSWRDPDAMQLLIDNGADVDAKGEYGETPLIRTLAARSLDCTKVLVNAGADPYLNRDDGADAFKVAELFGVLPQFSGMLDQRPKRSDGT